MFPRAILAFALLLLSQSWAEAQTTFLFAGSSSMYWNDLPREVAKVVDGKIAGRIGQQVIPEAVGRSGSDIRVYLGRASAATNTA